MANLYTRRDFVRTGAAAAVAVSAPMAFAGPAAPPIRLGMASYTFRNFPRAVLIQNLKTLNISTVNCKDVKDHLPMDPAQQAEAVAAYKAAGIRITAAGTVTFDKDDDDDIRAKFEYLKRASVPVVVAGGPTVAILKR